MKRGRSVVRLLVAFLPVTIAAIFLLCAGEGEPGYKGKRLSQWLNYQNTSSPGPGMLLSTRLGNQWLSQYRIGSSFDDGPARVVEAEEAVRHIGKDSLPWLVRWLRYEPPAWREKLSNVLAGWRMPFKESIVRLVRGDDHRVWQGLVGFRILGPEAAPAVPDLERLLRVSSSRSWTRADVAFLALMHVGRDGLPPLITALADPASRNRVETIVHFRSFNLGTNGCFAAPVLMKCVTDSNWQVAEAATWTLTELGLPQETVLPAIKRAVLDPRGSVRNVAVQALGRLGKQALPCTGLLTNCCNDLDPSVREAATNALRRVNEDATREPGEEARQTN